MRSTITILAALMGAAFGGAITALVIFFVMFNCLRFLSWVVHDDDFMTFMWFGLIIEPIAALIGFGIGGSLAITLVNQPRSKRSRRIIDAVVLTVALGIFALVAWRVVTLYGQFPVRSRVGQ